jgi:hypothetical protein
MNVSDPQGGFILTVVVHADPFELLPTDRGGVLKLVGFGEVTYEKYDYAMTDCPPTVKIRPPLDALLWISDLTPVFDSNGKVSDFVLQGVEYDLDVVPDLNFGEFQTEVDNQNNCRITGFTQKKGEASDFWGYTFAGMHSQLVSSDYWTIVGDESYVATDQISERTYKENTENTTLVLTVNQK